MNTGNLKVAWFHVCLATGFLTGCAHTGPQIEQIPATRLPHGANVEIQIQTAGVRARQKFVGELIEVRADGLVWLSGNETLPQLHFASWERIYRISATELPGFRSPAPHTSVHREDTISKMRRVSRYPQELPDSLFRQLLTEYNQTTLALIDDMAPQVQ